jgi:hypothetical protein
VILSHYKPEPGHKTNTDKHKKKISKLIDSFCRAYLSYFCFHYLQVMFYEALKNLTGYLKDLNIIFLVMKLNSFTEQNHSNNSHEETQLQAGKHKH